MVNCFALVTIYLLTQYNNIYSRTARPYTKNTIIVKNKKKTTATIDGIRIPALLNGCAKLRNIASLPININLASNFRLLIFFSNISSFVVKI